MDPSITPDRQSVAEALLHIRTSTEQVKDEMLTELLVRSYPVRESQDN